MAMILASTPRVRRRSDAVLDAVREAVTAQAAMLNHAAPLRTVTISVKMRNGSLEPRAVVVTIEAEYPGND